MTYLSAPAFHLCAKVSFGVADQETLPPPFQLPLGGTLALRAQCVLLLDYVPSEEPIGTPLGNTLSIGRPKLEWRGP